MTKRLADLPNRLEIRVPPLRYSLHGGCSSISGHTTTSAVYYYVIESLSTAVTVANRSCGVVVGGGGAAGVMAVGCDGVRETHVKHAYTAVASPAPDV